VVRSYFYLLYDYTRQRNKLRVVELKQLVIATPKGYKPMPSEWVYMTDEQKDEWLDEHGADTDNVELFIQEVA
jgi:hypothetical protein